MLTATAPSLSDSQIHALINLMKDSDDKVLSLISEQVSRFDHESMRVLDGVARETDDDDLIDNWYYVSRLSLGQRLKLWRQNPDLETGLLLVARLQNPALDASIYSAMLDDYAERISKRIRPSHNPLEISLAINHILFREENYLGNQIAYYDMHNNFLHTVMDSKTGNPIMLSAIYMLVARRLGLEMEGIGTPGHFIVKYSGMLLDPFFAGREITKDECIIRAQELNVYWREEYLDPVDDVSMVSRCIRNLIAIYKKQNRLEQAADASDLLKQI